MKVPSLAGGFARVTMILRRGPAASQAAHGRLGFLRMVTPKSRREARRVFSRPGGPTLDAVLARRDSKAGRTRFTGVTAARAAGPAAGARRSARFGPRCYIHRSLASRARRASAQPQGQRRLELGRLEPRPRVGLAAQAPRRPRAAPALRTPRARPPSRARVSSGTRRLPEQRAREGPAAYSRPRPSSASSPRSYPARRAASERRRAPRRCAGRPGRGRVVRVLVGVVPERHLAVAPPDRGSSSAAPRRGRGTPSAS